jgi:hypothetical protein
MGRKLLSFNQRREVAGAGDEPCNSLLTKGVIRF